MPDLTGLPALDVFIGMAFLFFLMATVCAALNELIQTALNARARTLTKAIKVLLDQGGGEGDDGEGDDGKATVDPVLAFFEQPRIARLAKPSGWVRELARKCRLPVRQGRRPSYIPARAFALAVLETATSDTGPKVGKNLFDEAEALAGKLGVPRLRDSLVTGLTDAQERLDAVRSELERSFDEAMDRASGWYKRYVQWWILAIALALAIGLNVDSFQVAQRLWKDDALRSVVVQQAQKAVADSGSGAASPPTSATPKQVADDIDKIEQLGLPIGWSEANRKGSWGYRVPGWLLTAFALSLGAPFWFDVLGKAARLRNVGNREGTAKENSRAAEDRDDPSGKRPA